MKAVVYATKGSKSDQFSDNNMLLEIWIENLQLCINENLEVTRQMNPRRAYKHFGTFDIANEFCEITREYLDTRTFFQSQNRKVFQALRQKLKLKDL